MTDFMDWFLDFASSMVILIFSLAAPDGFSFGYMILGIAVVGAVISGTVGMVAIVSNAIYRKKGD